MKFCEKLVKLRKNNNMSQEQLADKLSVSRQAVSKWELGSSIPDMEKIMQLCKILNCNLEDLVDDGTCGNGKLNGDKTNNINNYLKEFLNFVTRSINMFWSMRLVEKIKCLLEMFFVIFIMFLIWLLLGEIISSIFGDIIYNLPYSLSNIIYSIFSMIYKIFGLGVGVVIFIHIFKVRYLDYFITIEDDNTSCKSIEEPVEEVKEENSKERHFLEHKKNKIIIRDPKHSTYSFFTLLARLIILIIKGMFLCLMFLGIITLILLIFCFTYGVSLIGSGLFFIGVIFGLMGIIVINVIILKVMYNFVFNIKSNFKKIFYIFIIGFFLMGIGLGISFTAYLSFGVDNDVVSMEYDTYDETLKYDDKMILDFIDCSNVEIVYEDREDIKIELLFYNKGEYGYIDEYNMFYEGVEYVVYTDRYYDYRENFVDQFNYAIGLIKDKKRIDKIESVYIDDIKIYVSEDNYKKLKNNYDKVYG